MELLRSLLFVPADSPRKIAKARTLRPDAFLFDLEDAVAFARKGEARAALANELPGLAGSASKIFIRVNRVRSEFFDADLRVAVHPAVDGLLLPKCDEVEDLVRAHQETGKLEIERGIPGGRIKFLLILESALGVIRAFDLARSGPRVTALNFGAEDYCADMGISRTKSAEEVAVPRALVAQAARAAGLEAIDGVFTDFHDDAGLFDDTRRCKQMGYTGKTAIHPNQIETIHRAFAPTEHEMEWAALVVAAFDEAQARGSGVVAVRGRMVDEPVVIQARRILRQRDADSLGKAD